MNENLKQYRDNFINNNFYYTEEVTPEEFENSSNNNGKNQYYSAVIDGCNKYYKNIPVELTDEELSFYLKIKQYEISEKMDKKQNTMKNIMVFWVTLTIINLLGVLYIISKFAELM